MKKYLYEDFKEINIAQLNRMGADGWKVITAKFVEPYKDFSGWCEGGWSGLAVMEIEDVKDEAR